MATPTYRRDPVALAGARIEAHRLMLRSRQAELRGDPFCSERLRLFRLLRFRLGGSDQAEELMARAVSEGDSATQDTVADLLESLIYDLSEAP